MKKILLHCSSFVFVLFVSHYLGIFISPANAQQARVITVVPPTVQSTLDAGGRAEGTMKIINDGSDPISFTVSVQDYVVLDTKGTPSLLPQNTLAKKYSGAAWLGITPETFTVKAHDKQYLNYYLQIPANAAPGGHYAAVVFTPGNGNGQNGSGATIQTEIGTLFYIAVNGPVNEFGQVNSLQINPLQEYGPVQINAQIKNLGDIHIKPVGSISIYNMLGRTVKSFTLPQYNIFPGAARDYTFTLDKGFLFGRYKATLLASYGVHNNLPLSKTVYFWVLPWKILLIAILILIALILAIVLMMRRQKQVTPPSSQPVEENSESTQENKIA